MNKWMTILTAVVIAGAVSADAADRDRRERSEQRETRRAGADLDKRIQALNRLDNNPKAFQAGLAAVSKETAVPLPTIEAEHKDHPKVGLAGLFMAHELSVKTQKPVDTLLKQVAGGRSWLELARANNLDLTETEQKLGRIEAAMRGQRAASGATTPGTRVDDRTQVRAADKTELDRRVETLNSLDDQPLQMRTGLAALSKETAVPLTQIEELQKQHTSASIGDLFIAQELATKTQKPASEFLKQHSDGKSWTQIISDNNQIRTDIEQKLSRIEQAMKEAK